MASYIQQYYCNKCGYTGYKSKHSHCNYSAYEYLNIPVQGVGSIPIDWEIQFPEVDEGTMDEVPENYPSLHNDNSLFPDYNTAKAMADLNFLQDIVEDSQTGQSKELAIIAICKLASHIGYLEGTINATKQAIETLKQQMEGPAWDEEEIDWGTPGPQL